MSASSRWGSLAPLGGAGAPWLALALVSIASSACGFPNYFIQPDADGSGGSPKGGETTSAGATSGVAGNGGTEPIGGTDAAGGSSTGGTGAAGGSTGGTEPTAGGAGQAGADNEPGPLLFDDFESGEASQWLAIAGSAWSVTDDAESQSKVYQQYPVFADFYAAVATHGVWADQIIEAKVKVLSFGGTTTTDVVNLYGRFGNIDNYYAAVLRPDGRVALRASVGGSPPAAIKTSADFGVTTGVWYQLRFELVGTSLKLFVDGNLRVEAVDARLLQGTVAVGGDNSAAAFDDVRVTPP